MTFRPGAPEPHPHHQQTQAAAPVRQAGMHCRSPAVKPQLNEALTACLPLDGDPAAPAREDTLMAG